MARATPKSSTFGCPVSSTRMLAGLEVAVDDALVVGVLHRVAHPRQQPSRAAVTSRPLAAGVLVQRQAADELHGEERLAVVGQPGLVDLGDAGVVQPAQDLRLLGEALQQGGRDEAGADHLQGDGAARVVLLRLVDGPHAALAEQAHNAVVADALRATLGGRAAVSDSRARGLRGKSASAGVAR